MSIRIQARRGTEAQWQSANPILAEGELAYSTDTEQLKIGDGASLWSNLTYIGDLPQQSGFAGLFMTTDGTNLSFASPYPNQSGQNGKVLGTNGASVSWVTIDASSASAHAAQVAYGYATSASANAANLADSLYVTKTTPLFTNGTTVDFRSASVMLTSASISGIVIPDPIDPFFLMGG